MSDTAAALLECPSEGQDGWVHVRPAPARAAKSQLRLISLAGVELVDDVDTSRTIDLQRFDGDLEVI